MGATPRNERENRILDQANEVKGGGDAFEEQVIVERIVAGSTERRLPAGGKLGAAALCRTYGVGRTRVRRARLLPACVKGRPSARAARFSANLLPGDRCHVTIAKL